MGDKNKVKNELIDIFNQKGSSVFAVKTIESEDTRRYGIVSGKDVSEGLMLVDKLVEKPEPEVSPSLLGILGRYVFTPDIFNYISTTSVGTGEEIQLTDAMQSFAQSTKIYSWEFDGRRYDIGTMKDWFQSHLELSSNSEFSSVLKEVIKKL